jgi:hypothetical protein
MKKHAGKPEGPYMSPRKFQGRAGYIVRRLLLAASSVLVALGASALVASVLARHRGVLDLHYRHENSLPLWNSHPTIGYVNKPNARLFCQGNIRVHTDEAGFRSHVPVRSAKPGLRVVGVGDSVMWGAGVDEADSLTGMLRKRLQGRVRDVEVINAGVIGYSTLQTARLLEWSVVPLDPDVVAVNFCFNDILPTEDPFGNLPGIHAEFLSGIADDPATPFTDEERTQIRRFVAKIGTADDVWKVYQDLLAEPGFGHVLRRALIDVPIADMAALAQKHDFRLVYLIIPRSLRTAEDAEQAAHLVELFSRHGIAHVDLQWLAAENPVTKATVGSRVLEILARIAPFRVFRTLSLLRTRELMNEQSNYLDRYHLSRQGNRLAAEQVCNLVAANLTEAELLKNR